MNKPTPRPKWLQTTAKNLKEDYGVPCVKHVKDLHFPCAVCRLTIALQILDSEYYVGWSETKTEKHD